MRVELIDFLVHRVEPVGSACSLIALEYLARSPQLLSPNLAAFLDVVIQMDTRNFSTGERKFTLVDVSAHESLLEITDSLGQIYSVVDELRNDNSGFSTDELFRKDLKIRIAGTVRYGISSITGLSMQQLYDRDASLFARMGQFALVNELELHCVLVSNGNHDRARELVCVSKDDHLLSTVSNAVVRSGFVRAETAPAVQSRDEAIDWNVSFELESVSSRKRIAPFIQQAVSSIVVFKEPKCNWT